MYITHKNESVVQNSNTNLVHLIFIFKCSLFFKYYTGVVGAAS